MSPRGEVLLRLVGVRDGKIALSVAVAAPNDQIIGEVVLDLASARSMGHSIIAACDNAEAAMVSVSKLAAN
jgi:hypothetical protein